MAQATETESLSAKIQAILDKEPGQMTPMIARQLNVSEAEVLRHMPGSDLSVELDGARISDLIQELDQLITAPGQQEDPSQQAPPSQSKPLNRPKPPATPAP